MTNIKLVISDLDGTLFNSDKENYKISKQLTDLVKSLNKKGILFSIATGRPNHSCEEVIRELNITTPYIAYNGGMILDGEGNVIYNNTFPIDKWKNFMEIIDRIGGTILLYFNGRTYFYRYTSLVETYEKKEKIKCTALNHNDLSEDILVNKILIIGNRNLYIEEWDKHISEDSKEEFKYTISEDNYMEILKRDISKGVALKQLKEYLKIQEEKTIAIGNHLNDKELLEEADIGVAVQNAQEELKLIADVVTEGCYEEGVIEVLRMIDDMEESQVNIYSLGY